MALKREGTTTEHVFKIHIGSASQGALILLGEKVHDVHLYVLSLLPRVGQVTAVRSLGPQNHEEARAGEELN